MRLRDTVALTCAALVLLFAPIVRDTLAPPQTALEQLLDHTIARYRAIHPAPVRSWALTDVLMPTLSAQAPTGIQQSASRLDAATRCDSVAGTGAQTLTLINPGAGFSDYVTFVIANSEQSAAVTAANPIAVTSSGFNGTAPTFGSVTLLAGAQGTVGGPGPMAFAAPLKANTNTAPTVAGASVANLAWRFTACYYTAQ